MGAECFLFTRGLSHIAIKTCFPHPSPPGSLQGPSFPTPSHLSIDWKTSGTGGLKLIRGIPVMNSSEYCSGRGQALFQRAGPLAGAGGAGCSQVVVISAHAPDASSRGEHPVSFPDPRQVPAVVVVVAVVVPAAALECGRGRQLRGRLAGQAGHVCIDALRQVQLLGRAQACKVSQTNCLGGPSRYHRGCRPVQTSAIIKAALIQDN